MNLQSESVLTEPVTPAIPNASLWRNEDSGYHTSFTPGSIERSEILNGSWDAIRNKKLRISGQITLDCYSLTPIGCKRNCNRNLVKYGTESPPNRRGVKRSYNDDIESLNTSTASVSTPTSIIAGEIQKLRVDDNTKQDSKSTFSNNENVSSRLYNFEDYAHTSYPTTPVKKICRSSCKLSPIKRSSKKINFTIHSLSCEQQTLQPLIKLRPQSKVVRTIQFRPQQKVDLIKMLYEKACAWPAIMKIFSYLSNEDIFNFTLVSASWRQVWEHASGSRRLEYNTFLRNIQENLENSVKGVTPKYEHKSQVRSLKEIHNVLNTETVIDSQNSPPSTPRTIKFKRFVKSASLDSRIQLSCVRCCQPAKVTEETNGEEWAECSSTTCSYQFCRYCKCRRHPGKVCFQYDLEGPSPSKRKKASCAIATKKSRKNLRRLL